MLCLDSFISTLHVPLIFPCLTVYGTKGFLGLGEISQSESMGGTESKTFQWPRGLECFHHRGPNSFFVGKTSNQCLGVQAKTYPKVV